MLERSAKRMRRGRTFPADAVRALAAEIAARRDAARLLHPFVLGLSGLPGSGKSTLARQLAQELGARGCATCVLALDDFYLGRGERRRLARELHPLFRTRGPAGTHDVACLEGALQALRRPGRWRPQSLPRFDRLRDTRLPPSRSRTLQQRPEVVILEGWLVGVPPLSAVDLLRAPNELERNEDPEGRWRRAVNAALRGPYARLWRGLDLLVALLAPDVEAMHRWRREAELALARGRAGERGMDRAALGRFLQHYERWAAHALRALPDRADVVWRLDPRHRPIR